MRRKRIGEILRELCRYKGIEILDAHAMPDHIHMCLSVPPKFSIAMTTGYLKVKSAIRTRKEEAGREPKGFTNKNFWSRGYCVSTVGLDENQIREYIQNMEVYADRKETNIFKAIAKVFMHMKSDVNTPMGLPAPLMGLFNLFQFGKIGKEELTVAEIVQGMYYEGYDFRHFCSMSIPVMLIEVIVRISYCVKRINEGYALKESLAVGLNREKNLN